MTQTQQRIREAFLRGYRVKGSHLIGPKGPLKVGLYGNQNYPSFSTNWGGRVFGVPIHQFAAYQYYGDAAFAPNVVVRHLNGDTMDFTKGNILLGTHSDNELDKPALERSRVAKIARAAQPKTPKHAKLSPDQVKEIRDAYLGLGGKKAPNGFTKTLCEKYGVSRTVITHIKNGAYYASVV